MRLSQLFAYCALATSAINAVSTPEGNAVDLLDAHSANAPRAEILSPDRGLEKRKGGGGKGGGGGSGGGRSGGGSGTGSSGRTSPGSNSGGATRAGSGPSRSYGGGGFYGGGAAVPYKSGGKTPGGLLAGAILLPVAALAIMPGLWLYSVYPYYLHPYRFVNETVQNATSGVNQTLPVTCLCQDFSVCGCDNNDNPQYLHDLVGNGSYAALNKSLVTVSEVNGTTSLVINGTLPNGTTAPGGTDDAAAGLTVNGYTGYLAMVMVVVSTVILL